MRISVHIGAIIETQISSNGVISFIKEHSSSFGGEKNLGVSNLYLYMINDDNIKATKFVFFYFILSPQTVICLSRWLMLVCQPGRLYSVYASVDMSPSPKSNYIGAANLQAGWISMPETPPYMFHSFFSTKGMSVL